MRPKVSNDGRHRFGGPWTEVKLDAISDYLQFYTAALQHKPKPESPFVLWYVDAFAGSGERTTEQSSGGLLTGTPATTETVTLPGSAARALAVTPGFSKYVFVERQTEWAEQLRRLVAASGHTGAQVHQGEANAVLNDLFSKPPWHRRGLDRAVVFLDPYDMAVRWETLKTLADTKAVDVWYLFPLNATVRQLAHDYSAVDGSKKASLDQIFGCSDWQSELYAEEVSLDLFDEPIGQTRRVATQKQIEAYARRRLGTLFPYVSDPLPLLMPKGAQLFSLFCLSANDSPVAHSLISRGVSHVLKKYG